jgi:hypothetical protein
MLIDQVVECKAGDDAQQKAQFEQAKRMLSRESIQGQKMCP